MRRCPNQRSSLLTALGHRFQDVFDAVARCLTLYRALQITFLGFEDLDVEDCRLMFVETCRQLLDHSPSLQYQVHASVWAGVTQWTQWSVEIQ
jgi:hypothetical protein